MQRKLFLTLAIFGMSLAGPAQADGRIFVPIPDLSGYEGEEARTFLMQIISAAVVGSNCPAADYPDEKWSLLHDSADVLAYDQLGLSVDEYDDEIFGPAFDALDERGTCDKVVPKIDVIVDRLVALGGSLEQYPDQAVAYEEWNARQDRWDEQRAIQQQP